VFKPNRKNLIIPAVTCVFLLIAVSIIPALRPPSLNTLKLPLSLLTLARRELGGFFFFHRNLIEKELLAKQVDFLRSKINSMDEFSLENARLKELLSFKQKSPLRVITSRVIGRSPDSWSSTVIIDKGTNSGVKQGMAAITYLGLVGRVIEAADFASKILLINDPSLGVSAIVQRSRQEGLATGTLGTHLIMRYLPEGSDVKVGDVVVTSGLNALYPKGTLIGTVVDIGKEFSGLNTYAIIKPAVNLANIEEVFIVVQ
jgi:rod shape-determining protein MreC